MSNSPRNLHSNSSRILMRINFAGFPHHSTYFSIFSSPGLRAPWIAENVHLTKCGFEQNELLCSATREIWIRCERHRCEEEMVVRQNTIGKRCRGIPNMTQRIAGEMFTFYSIIIGNQSFRFASSSCRLLLLVLMNESNARIQMWLYSRYTQLNWHSAKRPSANETQRRRQRQRHRRKFEYKSF